MNNGGAERFVIEIELADRYDAESAYDYIEGRMALLKVDGTLSMRTINALDTRDAERLEHLRRVFANRWRVDPHDEPELFFLLRQIDERDAALREKDAEIEHLRAERPD